MFGKFNWNMLKVNRWSIVFFLLLIVAAIQGCNLGHCGNSIISSTIVFIIFTLIIIALIGWVPIIGQILAIILVWYLFDFVFLGHSDYGIKKNCGCSAFCNTVKPEIANQELTEPHPFKGGEDELEN